MTAKQWIKVGFVVLLELLLSYQWIAFYYHDSLFTCLATLAFSGIFMFVFLIVVLIDVVKYYRTRFRTAFKPTFACLIAALLLALPALLLYSRNFSPSILYCSGDNRIFDEMDINFRKNGTCEIVTQGLGSVTSRCTYQIHDTLIVISKNYFDTLLVSNYLLIRPGDDSTANGIEAKIYQVDAKMNVIPNSNVFTVEPG